jgi:hypothetical protein
MLKPEDHKTGSKARKVEVIPCLLVLSGENFVRI